MAKVQNPVIGRTKGSAGGMTWSKVYDKNVMKAKVFEANNPNTAAQQIQRSYFKSVSAQAAVFTPEQLRVLFPQRPKGISRRNGVFKQLAEYWEMVQGEKVMKLGDMSTIGNAPTMDMGTTTAAISSGVVTVTLDNSVKTDDLVKEYYFLAVLINATKNEVYFDITNAKVETGTMTINAPATWEDTDTIHALPLITDSTVALTSFGTLSVTKRPQRVNP